MGKYQFWYSEDGPYGATVRLLAGVQLTDRLVLDIGCGEAALSEALSSRGATYVGVDIDSDAIAKLTEGGHEAHLLNLTAPDLTSQFSALVAGRQLAVVLCLDVLEHLTDPDRVLTALHEVTSSTNAELIASIPHVAHIDLARQLLLGNWEMTETGLLDRTHLRFFTEHSLTELMNSTGWYESARSDVELVESDQHVEHHPAFGQHATLAGFLGQLRGSVDGNGQVNQFVRRYHRGSPRSELIPARTVPFLSVILRTQGQRIDSLADVLCCLAAQTDLDFEVVLVVHDPDQLEVVQHLVDTFENNLGSRIRSVPCRGGTRARPANFGLSLARGHYVAFLDDDDLVTADWVENFRRGALAHPGCLIRCWAVEQDRAWGRKGELASHAAVSPFRPQYVKDFDLIEHLRQNQTPIHCFTVPAAVYHMGLHFDESLSVCEDWQFLLRAASLCGVHDTRVVTAIYSKFSDRSSSHIVPTADWSTTHSWILMQLDRQPLLLPQGSARHLARMQETAASETHLTAIEAELAAYRRVAEDAHRTIDELKSSTSWKVSAPLRSAAALGRRIVHHFHKRREVPVSESGYAAVPERRHR